MQPEQRLHKVYVAGSFRDTRMSERIERVRRLPGFTVTHDWTLELGRPAPQAAVFDLEGVRQCEFLVAAMDYENLDYDYRGTFTELGAALVLAKRVIVVVAEAWEGFGTTKQYAPTNCFYQHPRIVYVTSFEAALRLLSVAAATLAGTRMPRLLVLGHGGHGKDTLAEEAHAAGLRFASSSEAANRLAVYPTLRERYGYESEQACFDDRRAHRMEWYTLICAYNTPDKARLAREIMQDNEIYVGMRDQLEFEASRSLFDLVVWVDATGRLPENDPSLFIRREQADVVVPNNGTLGDYRARIDALLELLLMPLLVVTNTPRCCGDFTDHK